MKSNYKIQKIEPSKEFEKKLWNLIEYKIDHSALSEFKRNIINIEGFRQVETYTYGKGDPIIFIHGLASTPKAYEKAIKHLGKIGYVVAPSLPGHGDTLMENWFKDKDFTKALNNYSEFINRVIAKYGFKKVTIVGHSFGGTIALKYAKKRPTKVEKLILVDTPLSPINFKSLNGIYLGLVANLEYVRHLKLIPINLLRNFIKNFKSTLYHMDVVSNILLTDDVSNLKVATKIYWGEKDSITPLQKGIELRERLKSEDFNVVKNRNHNWLLDSPEALSIL